MEKEPLVSVIMCVYNEEEYMIKEAVQAILDQTYHNWELIIVYDNPNDVELKQFIKSIAASNSKIRAFYNEQNLGTAVTRRLGVYNALGEYAAIADADDISMPTRLAEEMEYLINNKYDMVCSAYHVIDETGKYIRQGNNVISEKQLVSYMPYINEVCHSTVIFRRSVFISLGGYRNLPRGTDYDLWTRMLSAGYSIGYLSNDLAAYRKRQNSLTYKGDHLIALVNAYIRNSYKSYIKTGKSSDVTFQMLLKKYHAEQPGVQQAYVKSAEMREAAKKFFLQRKYVKGSCQYIKAVLGSRIYRLNIYNSIEFKVKKLFGVLEK